MCVLKADKSNARELSVKTFDGMYMFFFKVNYRGFIEVLLVHCFRNKLLRDIKANSPFLGYFPLVKEIVYNCA